MSRREDQAWKIIAASVVVLAILFALVVTMS
jgi:hypothetical protein